MTSGATAAPPSPGQRLHAWLFAQIDPTRYALLRIFVGISAAAKFIGINSPLPKLIQGNLDVDFPVHRYSTANFPPAVFVGDWLPAPTHAVYWAVETSCMVLGATMAIGLLSRLSSLALAACCWWLLLVDPAGFKHNLFALACFSLLLSMAPVGDRLSLDAWLRQKLRRAPRAHASAFALRLVEVQLAVIYLFSTAVKLSDGWWTGHLLAAGIPNGVKRLHELGLDWAAPLLAFRPAYAVCAWFVVGVEAFLVFGFFSRRLRPWAFFLGVLLHTGIDIGLDVGSYSLTMFAVYVAFIGDRPRRWRVTAPPRRARLWRALDWLCRLDITVAAPGSGITVTAPDEGENAADRADVVDAPGMGPEIQVWLRLPLTFPVAFFVVVVNRVMARIQARKQSSAVRP